MDIDKIVKVLGDLHDAADSPQDRNKIILETWRYHKNKSKNDGRAFRMRMLASLSMVLGYLVVEYDITSSESCQILKVVLEGMMMQFNSLTKINEE